MLPDLNENELNIMKELWDKGKRSAREIHDAIGPAQDWSYSTTRTVLERMVKKGHLEKVDFHGLFLYQPAMSKVAGLARLVRNFAVQVFDSNLTPVVAMLSESNALSDSEIEDLKDLLEQAEGEEP